VATLTAEPEKITKKEIARQITTSLTWGLKIAKGKRPSNAVDAIEHAKELQKWVYDN
jgi:hypothetical protein